MPEEIFLKMLGNIGVPAAVCFYTLFEVNKNVKRLADSINQYIAQHDNRIEKLEDKFSQINLEIQMLKRKGD